mmetsp:Transcript_85211/g.237897  ORF Transcript_85211/g.237897 Transcript_85211/m.237897 type:complete len:217 (-) Transcript_85211:436-1086(-)
MFIAMARAWHMAIDQHMPGKLKNWRLCGGGPVLRRHMPRIDPPRKAGNAEDPTKALRSCGCAPAATSWSSAVLLTRSSLPWLRMARSRSWYRKLFSKTPRVSKHVKISRETATDTAALVQYRMVDRCSQPGAKPMNLATTFVYKPAAVCPRIANGTMPASTVPSIAHVAESRIAAEMPRKDPRPNTSHLSPGYVVGEVPLTTHSAAKSTVTTRPGK